MATEFLSDGQVAAYGRFAAPAERAELERFFFLDDADRVPAGKRRGDHSRPGFSLQLGTVRFAGLFLAGLSVRCPDADTEEDVPVPS